MRHNQAEEGPGWVLHLVNPSPAPVVAQLEFFRPLHSASFVTFTEAPLDALPADGCTVCAKLPPYSLRAVRVEL